MFQKNKKNVAFQSRKVYNLGVSYNHTFRKEVYMVNLAELNARVMASGIKRNVIAQELRVSAPTLRYKLRGERPITADDVENFARVLNMTKQDVTRIFFTTRRD